MCNKKDLGQCLKNGKPLDTTLRVANYKDESGTQWSVSFYQVNPNEVRIHRLLQSQHIKESKRTVRITEFKLRCTYENASVAPECGSTDTKSLVINLNLTVPSAATGTRSADNDLDLATKEESYIDVTNGDYQICVFDKDGTYVGDKLSVIECKGNGVSDGKRTMATPSLSLMMRMVIPILQASIFSSNIKSYTK